MSVEAAGAGWLRLGGVDRQPKATGADSRRPALPEGDAPEEIARALGASHASPTRLVSTRLILRLLLSWTRPAVRAAAREQRRAGALDASVALG